MQIKRLIRYLIPSPAALTFVWISGGIFLIITAFLGVYNFIEGDIFNFLVTLATMSLPVMTFIFILAAVRERRTAPRAILWSIVSFGMFIAVITLAIAYWLFGPSDINISWIFILCCSPFFIIPGVICLYLGVKAWPELRRALMADRTQRLIELLSARGEASYLELGREVDLTEHQVEGLLTRIRDSEKIALVIDPGTKKVYTLIALIEKQRGLMAVVEAQGQIHIDDLSVEMGVPRHLLRRWIYDLVRRDLFSGYVDWETGIVSSLEATTLAEQKSCPNCGGDIELAGKGVIRCEYCGVEIFLPRGRKYSLQEQSTPDDRLKDMQVGSASPADSMNQEPQLASFPENRFRRLRELFKPNLNARRISYAALGLFVLGIICSLSLFWISETADSMEMPLFAVGFMVLPLVTLVLVISGFVEKRNPPRFLLWSFAVVAISLAGAIITGLMFIDPDAGAELSMYMIILSVAPFTLIFSLPAVYYGIKSWPEVATVLQLQLDERALDLIEVRGEISFSEIAEVLELPYGQVDNLVDNLLRSGRLSGMMSLLNQRVYTEETLADKRKILLEFIKKKGQVQLDEIIRHLDAPLDLVRDWIYQLFQLDQFNGYINWSESILYSVVAENMGSAAQCPNCGGELGLEAENVIQCQHCGSEIFSPARNINQDS